MFANASTRKTIAVLILTGLLMSLTACFVWADERHAGHTHGQAAGDYVGHDAAGHAPHHGGQITATKNYCFEVVYQPRETRIYLYDHDQKHLSMRGANGKAVMHVRGNAQACEFAAQYRAAQNAIDHDYLSVLADVSRIRDGDMEVTFVLNNLRHPAESAVSFTQTFAMSKTNSGVSVVPLTDADRPGIARQAVCPVMDTKLGSHGTPIKLMVGDQPVYV